MRKLLATTTLLIALATVAQAASDWFNAETIYWENDNFGIGRKTDRFYTNGVRLSLLLSDDHTPRQASEFRRWFCGHGWCGTNQQIESASLLFGQNFYTPENITIAAPQPNDRPWAGWLYAGVGETISDVDQRTQHEFELQLGILGPGAGAGATQKFVHNRLHFSNNHPEGWPNQLKNEPTLNLMYCQSRRYGNDTFDAVPEFGGMLGTVQTYTNAGATVRFGYHISGFPVALIPTSAAPQTLPYKWEVYVFAGGDGRWVPFNATLDGGFFRNGPKANDPKRFVDDMRIGASGRYRWFRVTYSVVGRSKEFAVQPGHVARQRFGSYALTIEPFTNFR